MKKIKSSEIGLVWILTFYSGEFGDDPVSTLKFSSKVEAVNYLNSYSKGFKSWSLVPCGGLSSW